MAFGLMGGPIQAQGHLQLALRILGYGQNPQAAADAPRWRIDSGRRVGVEPGTDPSLIDYLRARGHDVVSKELDATFSFRSEEHTSELQSLMRISYAVFCLKKKNNHTTNNYLF